MADGVLNGCFVYLAGPIDFAEDDGKEWRQKFAEVSSDWDTGLTIMDPTDKPPGLGSEVDKEKDRADELKKNGEWEDLQDMVNKYRRIDLRMVDLCDVFVMYVDTSIHMCGTYFEAAMCEIQKKPIFAIIKGGREAAPDWLFAVVHYQDMFSNVESCVNHLAMINEGSIGVDSRWVFIRKALANIKDCAESVA